MPEANTGQARRVAAFRENLLVVRLSVYAGGLATAAGLFAAVSAPNGWQFAAWLGVSLVSATALGLAIGRYVGRRGRGDA